MSTYAVGDLQGCLSPLLELLEKVQFNPSHDRLWLTGDLVNRGPESLATLRFIKGLNQAAITVLGNHDLHLLAVAKGYKSPSKKDTLSQILAAPDREELLNWLQQQPLFHYDPTLGAAMCHAGVPPIWSLEQAQAYASEVQSALAGERANTYFANMYGNTPKAWNSDLDGSDRLRVITNYFTRMRFCDAHGKLELKTKSAPTSPPEGYAPWFSFPNPRLNGIKIVFGHWASLMGKTNSEQFIGLDTGCIWGNDLTMIRIDDGERLTQPCGC